MKTRLTILGALLLVASVAVAQTARLVVNGSTANFGVHSLSGGFMPDPWTHEVTSGGNLDASSMGLGNECRGFVMAEPDVLLRYDDARMFLRVYFTSAADTTLIVRTPDGRWLCNDDSHGGLNPTVDIRGPRAGEYRIWVGSYRAGENTAGRLHVTEMRSRHP